MKKALLVLMSSFLILFLVGCGTAATPAPAPTMAPAPTTAPAAPAATQAPAPTVAPASGSLDFTSDFWTTPFQAKKQWVIGVSYQNLAFPYVAALQKAMESRATAIGVKLIEADAANDTNKELANVEDILAQKPDLLLFEAASLDASVASINAANTANVPVVQFNGKASGGQYVSFVGSDQSESGTLLGQFLINLRTSSGKDTLNCIYLRGVAGQVTDIARNDAMKKAIADAGLTSKFTFTEQYANYDRPTAQTVTESILSKSTNYDCLVSNNDDMLLGALAAATQAGVKIPMCGVDGLPETLTDIKAGTVSATVFQNPEGQAAGALTAAVAYLQGATLPKQILIPFILVTPANVDQVAAIANRVYGK